MSFELTNVIKEKIKSNCFINKNKESCGLIIDTNLGYSVYSANNISDNKRESFTIAPLDYLSAAMNGQVVACYHSHIDKNFSFSVFDKINCRNHKIDFILYHILSDSFYIIKCKDSLNYKEEEFKLGKSDCYSLVSDYYLRELNIKLPEIKREIGWENEWDLKKLEEACAKEDLIKEENLEKAQIHDIVCMDYFGGKQPSHFAIYLGNNYVFHHPRGKYPQIEYLNQSLINKIVFLLRKKTKE